MKTIFLAEDDEFVSRMYERAFRFGGYETRIIGNGAQVVDTLIAMDPLPAAVILDLVMPGMSGVDILQNIRADVRFDKVPVVILTNSIHQEQVQDLMDAGADLYLIKMDNSAKDVVQKTVELIDSGRATQGKL